MSYTRSTELSVTRVRWQEAITLRMLSLASLSSTSKSSSKTLPSLMLHRLETLKSTRTLSKSLAKKRVNTTRKSKRKWLANLSTKESGITVQIRTFQVSVRIKF